VPDLPTRLDLYAIGRDYVVQRAKRIDPGKVDVLGSDVNIFVGSLSVVGDKVVKHLGYAASRLYLDGAFNTDLDRYAFDRYTLTRKGASPAIGTVQFSRASAAAGGGDIPIGTKMRTLTGVEYITTTAATFGVLDVGPFPAEVRAAQAGKVTQVGAFAVAGFARPGDLFDRTITVSNPDPMSGGEDAEDDDTFKNRVRDFWRTARRGILAAIQFGALTVPGVVSAIAIEATTSGGQPARVVNLYIADSSGVASRALAFKVDLALSDFRAAGISVIINTSIPDIISVQLSLAFRAGVDTRTLTDVIRASVVEFVNTLPVNGTLYLNELGAVLTRFAADGLVNDRAGIASPTADLVPAIGRTLRTTPQNVTVTTPSGP
jgi:hypothetical protein